LALNAHRAEGAGISARLVPAFPAARTGEVTCFSGGGAACGVDSAGRRRLLGAMGVTEFLQAIGEQYGLLPVYALIVTWGGLQASSIRNLLFVLSIMVGVYATMFKAFDLKQGLDVFGLTERFALHSDVANGIAAAVFVFGLGFAAYGLKRVLMRKPSSS
jgi:hypothetical protein